VHDKHSICRRNPHDRLAWVSTVHNLLCRHP
jgi:hypothetical protein